MGTHVRIKDFKLKKKTNTCPIKKQKNEKKIKNKVCIYCLAKGLLYIIKWTEQFKKSYVQSGFLVIQKWKMD